MNHSRWEAARKETRSVSEERTRIEPRRTRTLSSLTLRVSWARDARVPCRRGGYSLIEMLAVVSVMAFALTATAVSLQTMFRVEGQARDALDQAVVLPRFAAQLRDDAHRSVAAEVAGDDPANAALVLRSPEQTMNYAFEKDRVVRKVTRDGEEVQHEVYRLPPDARVVWEVIEEPGKIVRATIGYRTGRVSADADRTRFDVIDAALGPHFVGEGI